MLNIVSSPNQVSIIATLLAKIINIEVLKVNSSYSASFLKIFIDIMTFLVVIVIGSFIQIYIFFLDNNSINSNHKSITNFLTKTLIIKALLRILNLFLLYI